MKKKRGTHKKAELVALLPATPCKPELREQVVRAATQLNISVAELQRRALAVFFGTK